MSLCKKWYKRMNLIQLMSLSLEFYDYSLQDWCFKGFSEFLHLNRVGVKQVEIHLLIPQDSII